jgi:hypothetical protein
MNEDFKQVVKIAKKIEDAPKKTMRSVKRIISSPMRAAKAIKKAISPSKKKPSTFRQFLARNDQYLKKR